MYVPPAYAELRPDVLFDFIEAHPLGAIVSHSPNGLTATHLPFVLDRTRGPLGTLQGHFARANAHHRALSDETEAGGRGQILHDAHSRRTLGAQHP